MGTIVVRTRKDGTKAYMAKIILKRKGQIIHRESETFERRAAAAAWMVKREEQLAKPGEIERLAQPTPTLGDAIKRLIDESRKEIGKSKLQVLKAIQKMEIADLLCERVTSEEIVKFARGLSTARRSPQTVGTYLTHLSSVMTLAGPAWRYPLKASEMDSARVVAKQLGLIGRAKYRDRRPTLDELEKLMKHFEAKYRLEQHEIPMHYLVAIAIFSTRRQSEITGIRWDDYEPQHSRVLVREMKNPRDKAHNDVWCDLPAPCEAIIKAMPRVDDRIFPYEAGTVSTNFSDATAFLGIDDLHFHDLRHEGISRLFEIGMNIPHVAAVSGHRTWTSLARYTHIRQSGDKYAGWKWLAAVTTPLQPQHTPQPGHDSAEP